MVVIDGTRQAVSFPVAIMMSRAFHSHPACMTGGVSEKQSRLDVHFPNATMLMMSLNSFIQWFCYILF